MISFAAMPSGNPDKPTLGYEVEDEVPDAASPAVKWTLILLLTIPAALTVVLITVFVYQMMQIAE